VKTSEGDWLPHAAKVGAAAPLNTERNTRAPAVYCPVRRVFAMKALEDVLVAIKRSRLTIYDSLEDRPDLPLPPASLRAR
jgi:hypothetical protein